jgi:hypothetical protein
LKRSFFPFPYVDCLGAGRQRDLVQWLAKVAGVPVPSGSLHAALKSGELLCAVMNKLHPGAVAKIHESKLAFKQMENIASFLAACGRDEWASVGGGRSGSHACGTWPCPQLPELRGPGKRPLCHGRPL